MSTPEQLLEAWHGQIVPQSFNGGFVTLSYIVSLLGAASTLELINRRTAVKGIFNYLLLVSAAVTMGGISIWCMHYIGNRAIDIAGGQAELQIAYSAGFTALSFFVPILVLLAAFVAAGANNKVQWWRVTIGGTLAGAAICGMHYLGNASISNYACEYETANVVGSAIISVAASIVALSLFFVFRAAWTTSWWKRGICAIVLAGAVSGMHWCASTGTRYRLLKLNTMNTDLSRIATVVVVICLSVGACIIIAGIAFTTNQIMKRSAQKAQQVVLALAVFDKQGRLLVSPDGLPPSEKITDTFVGRSAQEIFTVQHPLFQWMFRASRNWSTINPVIDRMHNHLAHLPHKKGADSERGGIQLISDHGEPIEHYEPVMCELFCTAAQALAVKVKAPLGNVGVLWDEILATGNGSSMASSAGENANTRRSRSRGKPKSKPSPAPEPDFRRNSLVNIKEAMAIADYDGSEMAERGLGRSSPNGGDANVSEYGRGSLLFLVRYVDSPRELSDLEAAGYRFAELRHVSGIIASSMQIKSWSIESKLRSMQMYARDTPMLEPGVHVGFFGVRARVGGVGFDVLVDREARNLLPSVQMPFDILEPWQIAFLRQVDLMTPDRATRHLNNNKNLSPKETYFASQLIEAISRLRHGLDDPAVFDDAVISAKVVEVPCRRNADGSGASMAAMIALCVVVNIHQNISSDACELVPLSFFKVHQLVDPNSPHHLNFLRSMHREIFPLINAVPNDLKPASPGRPATGRLQGLSSRLGRRDTSNRPVGSHSQQRSSSPVGSTKAGSTKELWSGGRASPDLGTQPSSTDLHSMGMTEDPIALAPIPQMQSSSFGGIMVSQEITVDVHATVDGKPEDSDSEQQHDQSHRRGQSQGEGSGSSMTKTLTEEVATAESGPRSPPTRSGVAPIRIIRSNRGDRSTQDNIGVTVVVAKAEADAECESVTFVDELFDVCLGQR
ncbi:hypothetical protein F503_05630 [Ophiostoma piceae UAMH 11346]|uniref:MHYT domain-containing protein n=1 Tax=Ophiostoma piceae (strain UAMH 11346) TaxID=1262450 RepID=S3DAH1_OPHP1|nr:hypothetical protein F503_05630 [Ophiostoma piceae UAMH 11346]